MYIIISYVFNDHKSNKVVADEIVTFAKRLKDNDLKRANVILDLTNKELVKCRSFSLYGKVLNNGEPDVTYQRLLDYVREQHPKEIDSLLTAVESLTELRTNLN